MARCRYLNIRFLSTANRIDECEGASLLAAASRFQSPRIQGGFEAAMQTALVAHQPPAALADLGQVFVGGWRRTRDSDVSAVLNAAHLSNAVKLPRFCQ